MADQKPKLNPGETLGEPAGIPQEDSAPLIDPRLLPPPGIPRPQVNVRPISMGEALGIVSSKDMENAEKTGRMQHLATDDEVDKAALMRPKAGAPPTTTGKGAKMVIPDNWEYKPNVPQATKDALATSDKIEHNAAVGPVTGAGKEALRTLSGASRIAQRGKQAAKKAIGMDVVDPRSKAQLIEGVQPEEMGIFGEHVNPEDVTPSDTSELVGGIGENVGEYMLGDALIKGIPGVGRLLSAGGKAKLPVRMLTSAAENAALAGGQDYVKSGGEPKAALEGAEYGGATGAGSELTASAIGGAKNALGKLASKVAGQGEKEAAKDLAVGTKDFIPKMMESIKAKQAARVIPNTALEGSGNVAPMSDTDRAAKAFIRRERLGKPEGRVAEPGRPGAMNVPPEEAQAAAQGYIQDLGAGKTGAPAPIKAKAAAQGMSLPEPGDAVGSREIPFPEGVSKIEQGTNKVLEGRIPQAGESIDPVLSHHTFPLVGEGQPAHGFSIHDSTGRPLGGITYTETTPTTATINSAIIHGQPGSGLGRKMYTALAKDLAAKGFDSLQSDTALTPEARRLWASMARDNPGIVEKGGRYRWDFDFLTSPESHPVGVSALNNQTESVLSKYRFRPTHEIAAEAEAATGAKPGPAAEADKKQMTMFFDGGKTALQDIGNRERWKEVGKELAKKGLKFGAAYGALDVGLDYALDHTPVVKDSPQLKTYIMAGAIALEAAHFGKSASKTFLAVAKKDPKILQTAATAMKNGQKPLAWAQGLAGSQLIPATGHAGMTVPGADRHPQLQEGETLGPAVK